MSTTFSERAAKNLPADSGYLVATRSAAGQTPSHERGVARSRQHEPAESESQVRKLVALTSALPEHVLAHDAAVARSHLHVHGDVRRTDLHKHGAAFGHAQLAVETACIELRDACHGKQVTRTLEQRSGGKRNAQIRS